jgi:serine/threonine protein kinase
LQASFPQYEILGILGRGGMGAVYQGRQKSLDRLVAIKILPPGLEDVGANFAERFKREAKAMARFAHPGIVSVFDAGETADGLLYFVMEYIEGTDVQKMVRENGPLPPEHALSITAHVCDALAYAHKRGVIHRDIKPSNIMVDREGQVKVADFGLAKLATDDSAGPVTSTNTSMGTPDFMAPEALYRIGQIDHRADLYAVGVMLYQMLTGELPRGIFEMPSVHRPGIDPRFDAIVARAMQKNPDKRYASATEIRTDLDQIVPAPHRSAVQAVPPPSPAPQAAIRAESPAPPARKMASSPGSGARRSRSWLWLTSGVAATLLLFAAGSMFFHDQATDRSPLEGARSPAAGAIPKAVESAPLVPRQTIDLLAITDPAKDRLMPGAMGKANDWEKSGGVLRYKSDGFAGNIVAPVAINSQHYEIEIVFARKGGGSSQLNLGFPTMPGNFVPFVFLVPGMKLVRDSAGPPWPAGLPDHGRIILRYDEGGENDPAHLVAQFDGQVIADVRQEILRWQKPMDSHPEFPGQAMPSIFSMRDSFEITAWVLRVFEGEANPLRVTVQ